MHFLLELQLQYFNFYYIDLTLNIKIVLYLYGMETNKLLGLKAYLVHVHNTYICIQENGNYESG